MKRESEKMTAGKQSSLEQGFSLVELLVVVAVILIITAIAIPNFIQSKMRANEASAVQNLRNISTGEVIYSTEYSIGYSVDLPTLGGTGSVASSTNAELIDSVLALGKKSGYTYSYTVLSTDALGNPTSYSITADPIVQGYTGNRHFYTDESTVIRQNSTVTAASTDAPI